MLKLRIHTQTFEYTTSCENTESFPQPRMLCIIFDRCHRHAPCVANFATFRLPLSNVTSGSHGLQNAKARAFQRQLQNACICNYFTIWLARRERWGLVLVWPQFWCKGKNFRVWQRFRHKYIFRRKFQL